MLKVPLKLDWLISVGDNLLPWPGSPLIWKISSDGQVLIICFAYTKEQPQANWAIHIFVFLPSF